VEEFLAEEVEVEWEEGEEVAHGEEETKAIQWEEEIEDLHRKFGSSSHLLSSSNSSHRCKVVESGLQITIEVMAIITLSIFAMNYHSS